MNFIKNTVKRWMKFCNNGQGLFDLCSLTFLNKYNIITLVVVLYKGLRNNELLCITIKVSWWKNKTL